MKKIKTFTEFLNENSESTLPDLTSDEEAILDQIQHNVDNMIDFELEVDVTHDDPGRMYGPNGAEDGYPPELEYDVYLRMEDSYKFDLTSEQTEALRKSPVILKYIESELNVSVNGTMVNPGAKAVSCSVVDGKLVIELKLDGSETIFNDVIDTVLSNR